jgi:hypothetical protein
LQQNFLVVYDRQSSMIGLAPSSCTTSSEWWWIAQLLHWPHFLLLLLLFCNPNFVGYKRKEERTLLVHMWVSHVSFSFHTICVFFFINGCLLLCKWVW